MAQPLRVVRYDRRWPSLFAEERARIEGAIGHLVMGIEHVGATSVPGCGGKPIIDIMAGVADLDAVEKCVGPLVALGYEYMGEFGIPGRHYFRKGVPRSHHLHMVRRDSDFWRDHLLFRDYLRAHVEEAERYYRLKKGLAARYAGDGEAYTEAKSPFIQAALARARAARPTS